ncbi:hypothetical protein D915_010454 [Fasciola hepatica]|uniref:Uncharacterized protein n=1 Tax=Fasciola hepatica TaxID=6192 RepID=A0A4E0RVT3_FASHE|nr:hypothetical protein D915_010454 [Fasciola hepatica]
MSYLHTNLTHYGRSPYETSCTGLVPKQTVRLFNSHSAWVTCDYATLKAEADRTHLYNERRRLDPSIPHQEELSSQLHMEQLNLTRRLGKFITEHNRAVNNAIRQLQQPGRVKF